MNRSPSCIGPGIAGALCAAVLLIVPPAQAEEEKGGTRCYVDQESLLGLLEDHVNEVIAALEKARPQDLRSAEKVLGGFGPLREGPLFSADAFNLEAAGEGLNAYLEEQRPENATERITDAEKEIVRDIKEKLAYVALDYEKELEEAEATSELEQNYELPDGQVITIGSERFRAPETLFQPNFIGLEQEGIHKLTFSSIMKCDVDIRKDLYNNLPMDGEPAEEAVEQNERK